jgi:hypothetical protein
MIARHVLIPREGMAHQNDVGPIRIERTIGFIRQFNRRKFRAAIKLQRPEQFDMGVEPKAVVISHYQSGLGLVHASCQRSRAPLEPDP